MPHLELDDTTYEWVMAEAQRRGITPAEVVRLVMEETGGDSAPKS